MSLGPPQSSQRRRCERQGYIVARAGGPCGGHAPTHRSVGAPARLAAWVCVCGRGPDRECGVLSPSGGIGLGLTPTLILFRARVLPHCYSVPALSSRLNTLRPLPRSSPSHPPPPLHSPRSILPPSLSASLTLTRTAHPNAPLRADPPPPPKSSSPLTRTAPLTLSPLAPSQKCRSAPHRVPQTLNPKS